MKIDKDTLILQLLSLEDVIRQHRLSPRETGLDPLKMVRALITSVLCDEVKFNKFGSDSDDNKPSDVETIDVEPNSFKCIVTDIYFENAHFNFGILRKIGPDAFKDERRFPTYDSKLKIGTKVSFMKMRSMEFKINDRICYFVDDSSLYKVPQDDK